MSTALRTYSRRTNLVMLKQGLLGALMLCITPNALLIVPLLGVTEASSTQNAYSDSDYTKKAFSGLDLQGVDFSRSILKDTKFSNTTIWGAAFYGADLTRADFTLSQLGPAGFAGARCPGAMLFSARLFGNLDGADFSLSDFRGATLFQTSEKFPNNPIRSASARYAKFCQADMRGSGLEGVDFESANLQGANLAKAHLENCILKHANLNDANLSNAVLTGADLRGARLLNAQLGGARLKEALFDSSTQFPKDFNFKNTGMRKK